MLRECFSSRKSASSVQSAPKRPKPLTRPAGVAVGLKPTADEARRPPRADEA